MTDFRKACGELFLACLGRRPSPRDGLSEDAVARAEKRLGIRLPGAVREYYLVAGNASDLNMIHNVFYKLDDLHFDGEYLLFMDENQSVVSWGIKRSDLRVADPIIWQRNNTAPIEWYSEQLSFSAFMKSMFEWYREEGLWRGG